jgi:hypothetical protein
VPFLEAFDASEQLVRGTDTITVRVRAARSQLQIVRQPDALPGIMLAHPLLLS